MNLEQKVNIHNRFDVYKNDEFVGYGENIILNQAWSRIADLNSYFNYIHFGTGIGTIAATRTTLFTHLNTKAAVNVEKIKALPVSSVKKKITLNPEEFVGSTLTEVGIAWGSAASNLCTHAMLKDAEGNPITITKTATDVISIFATVFVTISAGSDVEIIGMPANNQLINYIVDQSAPTISNLMIGTCGMVGHQFLSSVIDQFDKLSTIVQTKEVANKRVKYSRRITIAEANRMIREFSFENLFRVKLPNPLVFEKQSYMGVLLGTGDGVKKNFNIPSSYINIQDLLVKLNGSLTSDFTTEQINSKFNFQHFMFDTQISGGNANRGYIGVTQDKEWVIYGFFSANRVIYYQIYKRQSGGTYTLFQATPYHTNSYNYQPVAVFSTNDRIVFINTGMIQTFVLSGGTWAFTEVSVSSIYSADASSDLEVIMIGKAIGDMCYKFIWDGTTYVPAGTIQMIPNGYQGIQISDDKTVLISTTNVAPGILSKVWNGTTWQTASIDPGLTTHANRACLSSDGTKLVVADYNAKNVYYYKRTGLEWDLINTLTLSINANGNIWANSDFTSFYVGYGVTPFLGRIDLINDTLIYTGDCSIKPNDSSVISFVSCIQCVSDLVALGLYATNENKACRLYDVSKQETLVKFNIPPAAGVAVTADYSTAGLHKTDQYVVDVGFTIQFGEGV